jgi:hypothetical protein
MVRIAAGAFVALALHACSSGGGQARLSTGAQRQLAPMVQTVRQAAETNDPAGAAAALDDLRRTVATLERAGSIDPSRADAILAAAAQVEGRLALVPTTTTTTTTTTRPLPSLPSVPVHGWGGKDEKGNGKND